MVYTHKSDAIGSSVFVERKKMVHRLSLSSALVGSSSIARLTQHQFCQLNFTSVQYVFSLKNGIRGKELVLLIARVSAFKGSLVESSVKNNPLMDQEALVDTQACDAIGTGDKNEQEKAEGGKKQTLVDCVKAVTVEPTMFCYMMAFMLTSVVEKAFFMYKACTVDLGFPEAVCLNLTDHEDTNKQVQVVVSTFHQNNDIASHIVPIFLALFVGAWSDRRGRKLLLLLGLIGKLWYSVWIVIISLQDTWSLKEIIWTASFPSGFTGADLSIFTAAFAYISDITTPDKRTLRITILDVTYLTSMPLGVALGKYLFAYFNRSFTIMFALNASLLSIALLYSFFRLDWITNSRQRPLKLCCWTLPNRSNFPQNEHIEDNQVPCFLDFFDKQHLVESVRTITSWRPNRGRFFLIILIFSMGFYTFQRDERQMSYYYTNLKFKWNVDSFSDFRIFQSGIYVVGTFLCIPLMGKLLHLGDTMMLLIGTSSHALARVVFALADKSWLFYVGASVASLGPIVAPVLRSMASKIVPANERGKVFAVLSVADTTVPLFSGVIYSQVYKATIHTYPSAIYWVTIATQMFVFTVALVIRFYNKNLPLEISTERTPEN